MLTWVSKLLRRIFYYFYPKPQPVQVELWDHSMDYDLTWKTVNTNDS